MATPKQIQNTRPAPAPASMVFSLPFAARRKGELFEACTKKHRVNLARQASGYAVKEEGDNKHI